jgi:hypothetical protein
MRIKVYFGDRLIISYMIVDTTDKLRKWTNRIAHTLQMLSLHVRDMDFFTSRGYKMTTRTTFEEAFPDVEIGVLELYKKRM